MLALKLLNPEIPLIQRGEIVTPGWLLEHPLEGYRLISGSVPDLLEQLHTESWLSRLKTRAENVRQRALHQHIELAEEQLRIYLLSTSRALAAQWQERQRLRRTPSTPACWPGRAPGDRRGRPDRPAQRQHRPVPCRRGDRRGSRRPGPRRRCAPVRRGDRARPVAALAAGAVPPRRRTHQRLRPQRRAQGRRMGRAVPPGAAHAVGEGPGAAGDPAGTVAGTAEAAVHVADPRFLREEWSPR